MDVFKGELFMIKKNIFALTSFIIAISMMSITSSFSQQISFGVFTGNLNTIVSSGFQMRASDRNCSLLKGFTYSETLDPTNILVAGTGEGCAVKRTDPYGNTAVDFLEIGNANSDDGNMNYDNGDIFSATQQLYSEFNGSIDSGLGVSLSFVASVNPGLSFKKPTWAPFSSEAKKEYEQNLTLLNAYVTTSSDLGNGMYGDFTIGRQVTNWGEATFLPIGIGATINAIDVAKLRSPGSSIKEALLPTEQLTAAIDVGNGIGIEAYVQLNSSEYKLDAASSFFGSEIVGKGGSNLVDSVYDKQIAGPAGCPIGLTGSTDTTACNAALIASARTEAGIRSDDIVYAINTGAKSFASSADGLALLAAGVTNGATTTYGAAADGNNDLRGSAVAEWSDIVTQTAHGAFLASDSPSTGALAGFTVDSVTCASGLTSGIAGLGFTGCNDTRNSNYVVGTVAGITAVTSATLGLDAAGLAAQLGNAYGNLLDVIPSNQMKTFATVTFAKDANFEVKAKNSGQIGLAVRGYADDLMGGVDWSIHANKFHSKTPYIRMKGKGGIYAGDVLGIFNTISAQDTNNNGILNSTSSVATADAEQAVYDGLYNAYYSGGVCNAAIGAPLASAYMNGIDPTGSLLSATQQAAAAVAADGAKYTSFDVSTEQKRLARQNSWEENINGEWVHNGAKCFASATAFTQAGAAANAVGLVDTAVDIHATLEQTGNILLAALTPLNATTYQLIYPEDLTSLGISGSTTYNGTAIQLEVNYRPDFPLATAVSDQIGQISDVNGAYNMLDMLAYNTIAGLGNGNSDNYNSGCTDENATPGDVLCNQDGDTVSAAIASRFVTDDDAAGNLFASYIAPLEGFAPTPAGTGGFLTAVATGAAGDGYEFVNDAGALAFQTYLGSKNSGGGLAFAAGAFNKAIRDGAYAQGLVGAGLGTAEDAAVDATLTGSGYVSAVNNAAAVAGAYWGSLVNFNRSSLTPIAQADTVNDYYSTPFIKYDVWTLDIGTTTSFNASHPITQGIGADSSVLLTEWGVVSIPDLDNDKNGFVARNGFQAGIGGEKCLGGLGGTLSATPFTFGATTALTHLGAGMADGLFGNGKYCESNNGASATAMTYRVIGSATYNNLQNTSWSMSPRFVWSHDPKGWAPTSVGGFNEGRASMSLGLGFNKAGGVSVDLNYVNQLGDEFENSQSDKDFISASVSYAF
jgi:hypothetical protein